MSDKIFLVFHTSFNNLNAYFTSENDVAKYIENEPGIDRENWRILELTKGQQFVADISDENNCMTINDL